MARCISAIVLFGALMVVIGSRGSAAKDESPPPALHDVAMAGVRPSSVGSVDSLTPCGTSTGGPKNVTFTVTASYAGTNGRWDRFTTSITVTDADGHVIATANKIQGTSSGEQGCIACPVSTPATHVNPGSYHLLGTLVDAAFDAHGNPIGPPTLLGSKTCIYNLTAGP
jgi:hypothetical protein